MGAIGHQKNRSLASLYDRTGVCTIRTLIKNDQNDLRTGTRAEFRPFVEALIISSVLKGALEIEKGKTSTSVSKKIKTNHNRAFLLIPLTLKSPLCG